MTLLPCFSVLCPDVDAQVGSDGLVAEVLLNGSVIRLAPDPA